MSAKELLDSLENPNRDFDLARMEYFVKDPETKQIVKKWKVNPKGHVNPIHAEIRAVVAKYEDFVNSIEPGKAVETQRTNLRIETTKKILELGFLDFNYDEASQDENLGPAILDKIADDVYSFLVVVGGKAEYQLFRQRLKQAILNS
jgi:hypothetical protein